MYAKIFRQIFDSSIADNYELRHFFMDMLVLADRDGVVNMTHNAIAATTRIPVEKVRSLIATLEAPDPDSQTPDFEGRRLKKIDDHRSWGWLILNYQRFREIANDFSRKEGTRERVRKLREYTQLLAFEARNGTDVTGSLSSAYVPASVSAPMEGSTEGRKPFVKPTLADAKLHAVKIGLPEHEAEKFINYYESNGWRVGKNSMKLWTAAMANWKRHWDERRFESSGHMEGRKSSGNVNF